MPEARQPVDVAVGVLIERDAHGAEGRFLLTSRPEGTFVDITCTGFEGNGDEVVQQALASTEGFTFVLSGLKAFLEHNVRLNLVPDRFPKN